MKNFLEKLSEFQKSVLLSVGLHVLLFVLFLLFRSGLDLPDQEFAEIGFVASTTSRAYRPQQQSAPVQTETQQPAEEPPPPPATQPQEEAKAPPVNLPKRRMLEEDEPQLRKRDSGKLTPSQENMRVAPRQDVYDAESMQKEVAERASSGKTFAEPTGGETSDRFASPPSDMRSGANNQNYTLEGDASKRSIVTQVLPEYPSGLQREAVVKIRFWVLPDGRVGAMIPVQKGDPTLEEITMKALRQWRFNALPPGEEQQNVEGVITFVYKLR